MNSKKIVYASLIATVLAATTVAMINATNTGKNQALFDRALATEKSFTFNEDVAKTYWNSDVNEAKTIASTAEHDAISARAQEIHYQPNYGFGVENSFFWNDYSINEEGQDTKIMLAVGVNNLQSFSYTFHINVDEGKQSRTSFTAKVKFFGEDYDVDKCITAAQDEDVLYEEEYNRPNGGVVKDYKYTETWTKPDQNYVIRYALFELKIFSKASTCGGYCALFLENIGVTWNC